MNRRHFLVLLTTIIGSSVVLLDGAVVRLALPALSSEFQASFADLQWIADGYLLSLSALILLGGSLGDIFGRKKIFFLGLVGFGICSILCGLSQNTESLITLRIIQGVFGALLVPGSLAIINTNFTAQKRGAAIGHWAAWSSITTVVGPVLGGILIDSFSWRAIFFLNIPLVILCFFLGASIKESKAAGHRRVDLLGGIFIVAALAGITFGLIEGPAHQWPWYTLGALIAGIVTLILFVIAEAKQRDPMVNLRLFASRNFTASNIATFAMYGGLGGFFFVLTIHLQTALGYSSLLAGLSTIPVTLLLLFFSGKVGKLTATHGPRLFMTLGPILSGVGMISLVALAPGANYWLHIFPGIMLFGVGLVLTVTPLTITVMNSVSAGQSGIASGINNAISRASGLIVVALLGIFGASQSYRFAIVLCTFLAILAGVCSFLLIQHNPTKR